ncbi:exodeoxyribonuclease V subunit beta [Shewanella sp. UCD-KL12]|uniref:exodeoxyribonuclease V subunit beta n=1 Tax=Shewanella sp. UCD-KL12 TaxID=1917163 RepID=UPI000970D564|nr:exodeoxyribonuclease V subunit beta [Shewanella sp. UCD-KL12]
MSTHSNQNKDTDVAASTALDTQAIISQPLDTLTLPFGGSRLIEASAGTGKTYTIAGLYIRLLLGHKLSAPLTCEQILVVTFTNAATGELRDRIRKKIQLAYRHFIGLDTGDQLIDALYQQTPETERPLALKRLDLALKSLDEAAIFTIHGFCQRILADMAFESSLLFESEFTLDDSEFLHHAVRDFWREQCYSLPLFLAEIIQNKFADPDTLSKQLRPLLGASQANAQPKPIEFSKIQALLTTSLSRLKLIWPRERDETEALLHLLPLNGVRFGKKADNFPKLAAMFDAMDNWCRSSQGLPPLKVLDALSLNNLKLNKGGEVPSAEQASLLAHIERLSEHIKQLVPSFIYCARDGIKQRFAQQKIERNLLTPDDLLITLAGALTPLAEPVLDPTKASDSAQLLAKTIAKRFPIALIDEFQDTDPLQYTIFNRIYQPDDDIDETAKLNETRDLSLLMIGDPKQAIYAFRGADIHTYIQARTQTQQHYNLDTNYRSSHNMIVAVNTLFEGRDNPFISHSIPFEGVKPSPFATGKILNDTSASAAALKVRLLSEDSDKGLNKTTARKRLSEDAASEIKRLLSEAQTGECGIVSKSNNAEHSEPLKAKDIAILVRDRNEAAVIQASLRDRGIGSVFLSRDSVFNTIEAREMALVLKALANPKDERALRSALATSLLGYGAEEIHQFNQDEMVRQGLLEQFDRLHQNWLRRGVMPALLNLANETKLIERLLNGDGGDRRLTDFRHLAELLQQKATELDGVSALVNWYEQALIDSNAHEEAQLRLESEQNLVQIVTIHKSKGLEYPICFIPFVSLARDNRRKPTPMLYHDNNQLIWDIEQSDEGWERHKQENLAEDLRLLYVALTRPVYLCYLYIANQSRFTKKAGITSRLHETGIGYLLGINDKSCDFTLIQTQADKLSCEAISVSELDDHIDPSPLLQLSQIEQTLAPKVLKRPYSTPWRVGSYSGLVRDLPHERVVPGADDEVFPELEKIKEDIEPLPSRFSFERGANAGSFMHLVLELIDFNQADKELAEHLPTAMEKYGIDESWYDVLYPWYLDLLNAALTVKGSLKLAHLSPQQKLVEMEFYLPIEQLKAQSLNTVLTEHGYSAGLNFDDLMGMLKGFIDLTFEHRGKYYIADYKSNHLGDDFTAYNKPAMSEAIRSHRYDLQYIIYTLALHRYLSLRMPHYDYDQHIGGCYYLFLRGMSVDVPGAGVFFDKPPRALVESLDQLFDDAGSITAQKGS